VNELYHVRREGQRGVSRQRSSIAPSRQKRKTLKRWALSGFGREFDPHRPYQIADDSTAFILPASLICPHLAQGWSEPLK
jgi:hypothetical protein